MSKIERDVRFVESGDIEMRVSGEGDAQERYVDGLGIVYDREVEIWPGFFETIAPGAFGRSVKGAEIKSFFNHNPDFVLSTTRSKPALHLEETEKGLRFKSPIPPTSYGEDLRVNLERKNVRGASFSFTVTKDVVTIDERGDVHRRITEGDMYEIGPVTNPAYPQAKVGLRDAETAAREIRERMKAEENESAGADLDLRKCKLSLLEREV